MAKRRGRPPGSDGASTRRRLLDAAVRCVVRDGFERVTVADIAAEAGLTPAAAYNHFTDKGHLVFEAADLAVRRVARSAVAELGDGATIRDITVRYLGPDMADSRRLILELHTAATRRPELAELVDRWYARVSEQLADLLPPDAAGRDAAVVALHVLTIGTCHIDRLNPAGVDLDEVAERVGDMVDHLFGPNRTLPR